MGKANTFKEMAAFTVDAGSFLGFIRKLPQGLVFFALQKDKTPTDTDYTCKINGISTESYKCVYRKGRYYIRFFVFGKVCHTEVINFTKVDILSENKQVMAKDMSEELDEHQYAMLEVDKAIINATLAAANANLKATKSIRDSTKVIRELTLELDSISRKANKPIEEAIGEAVRKANKPIEEAIRNFREANRNFREANRNFREANRNFREAERKAKDAPVDTTKALEELLNALSID